MKAYVLMKIRTGSIPEVVKNLRSMSDVLEAHQILGPYDIIALIEGSDLNRIGHVVNVDIQVIPGVLDTLTCLAIED